MQKKIEVYPDRISARERANLLRCTHKAISAYTFESTLERVYIFTVQEVEDDALKGYYVDLIEAYYQPAPYHMGKLSTRAKKVKVKV